MTSSAGTHLRAFSGRDFHISNTPSWLLGGDGNKQRACAEQSPRAALEQVFASHCHSLEDCARGRRKYQDCSWQLTQGSWKRKTRTLEPNALTVKKKLGRSLCCIRQHIPGLPTALKRYYWYLRAIEGRKQNSPSLRGNRIMCSGRILGSN